MAGLSLEQHNGPRLDDPSWAMVESCVRSLHPRDRGFFILSRAEGGYVQAAGARLRIIAEWRVTIADGGFRHFVLGRPGGDMNRTSINTCVGIIQLQVNEILTMEEVVDIFRAFYETNTVPDRFVAREVTASFSESTAE